MIVKRLNALSYLEYTPNGYDPVELREADNMAQSQIKTPLEVPVFWEAGANSPTEWSTWFTTLKTAMMARDNFKIKSKFENLDDILIISKGTLEEHEKKLDKVLQRLNEENLAISIQKCEFAKEKITWLGFIITPHGVTPTKQKCHAIRNLENYHVHLWGLSITF